MSATALGRWNWTMSRDKDGHRDYTLETLVEAATTDGPYNIMGASGLPAIGATWSYGGTDSWAFCWPEMSCSPVRTKEPGKYWKVTQKFSTKPLSRCQNNSIENPLNEPMKISGSFSRFMKKAELDANGVKIESSSHEQIRGIKKPSNHPTVKISQNVSSLGLDTFAAMVNTVNDRTLWGLSARKIMLANAPWSRQLYGTCTYYYTRTFEFEIHWDTWDEKDIMDVGFKEFDPNHTNDAGVNIADRNDPASYKLIDDDAGDKMPEKFPLDGAGNKLTDALKPQKIRNGVAVELLGVSNFSTLGLPTTL